MELRALQYFLVVAREENITKAAALLHVTQPTLSRQMMQLEEELGVSLFKRSSHSILLTEQGMLLRRRAQELVSLADKTRQELAQQQILSGEVSIGSGEYRSSALLAQILAGFHKQHPQVRYEIFSGNSDDIKERIERGLLDMGFLLEPVDVSRYEFVRLPVREEWGVFVAEDSELAHKTAVTPQDLASQPLIFARRDLVKQELTNWFGSSAEGLDIIASGNLPFNLSMLVQQGMGVHFSLAKNCRYEGVCFRPLSPRLESNVVLAWKKNQAMSPAAQQLIEEAKKYIQRISCNKE